MVQRSIILNLNSVKSHYGRLEIEGVRERFINNHVDMRTHAFLTITTNICWEGCEKEGAVAERELKMQ